MQLKITINHIAQCSLPIAYHHIQQAAIYALIRGDLHDNGAFYLKRDYKLFTFGPFIGKYKITGRRITFYDQIQFEFRCFDVDIMRSFIENIQEYGFRLGDISYHNIDLELNDKQIEESKIKIKMLSPICAYQTDELRHTIFLSPKDEAFYDYISDNFIRKYCAAYDDIPPDDIQLSLISFNQKDKYFTKYKNYFIEAWKGIYLLEGYPEDLTFLYNVGIGSKNSQGFGMFEIIGE